jgi:putative ABC transport system permease protein
MILFATLKLALRALRRNKLRTLLTMLGIIFGVATIIVVVSIGNGAKAQIEAQIASLGQNLIILLSGNFSRGGFSMGFGMAPTLTKDDYEAIRKEVEGVSGVSPEVRASTQIAAGNQNEFVQVFGVGADYVDIRSWPLASGANFTEADVRRASKVAILGQTTANTLFGESEPVGQILRVKNAPFIVVGILSPKGMNARGEDQDDIVLVPYTSAMKRLTGATTFRSLNIQAASADAIGSVTNQIADLLRQRHRIGLGRDDDFMLRTQQEISEAATATSKVMTVLLWVVACVSLLVGGIGIMNIMLVSVTERTREIGVRLAVGARGRDILLQFLIEAVTLTVLGGVIGILMGVAGSRVVSVTQGWVTLVSLDSVVLAFGFSAVIGIFFGFYPARKASRLDPIEALRYE